VRGIVNRLHRTTAGATARPGDPLAEIVPVGDTPVVEAWLRPADIAFLHPGQAVRVQITAYDAARYGRLDGEILRIGADAVRRSDRDTEDVFVVEIRTSGSLTDADGTPVAIIPGMMAQVDILTGRKTVLDYLIRPVLRLRD
jgi:adhesin transport system membrane fusion protein